MSRLIDVNHAMPCISGAAASDGPDDAHLVASLGGRVADLLDRRRHLAAHRHVARRELREEVARAST